MSKHLDNIVNQQFKKVYDTLVERGEVRSKSDIADKLGTYNHIINGILKGQRSITIEQLNKLFHIYQIDANFLFGLSDKMFATNVFAQREFAVHDKSESMNSAQGNIELLPHKALAGNAIDNPRDMERLSTNRFSLPGYKGELIAIEIEGDSMSPTLVNGDTVVCERIERGVRIMENNVYVVVTDVVVAKRIQQVREEGVLTKLRLISDNHSMYRPYEIELDSIQYLLKVKCRLTSYGVS